MGGAVSTAANTTPWLNITPGVIGRIAVSTMLMGMAMYYLTTGRRDASMNRILIGAALAFASLLVF
jgi:hypothetical protein